MSQTLITAVFEDAEDAQTAINEIIKSGFDSQNISLLIKNKREDLEPEENNEDYESELDGEGMQEVHGLIDPIASGEFGYTDITIPTIGDMILAGPISNIAIDDELEEKTETEPRSELEFDKVIEMLGLPVEELSAFEGYLKNNYVMISVPVEEETSEEINTILSDSGAELIEETKADW